MTGFFNTLVTTLSFGLLDPVDWLANPATAMPAIVLMSAWRGFPFQMVICLAGLQSIVTTSTRRRGSMGRTASTSSGTSPFRGC